MISRVEVEAAPGSSFIPLGWGGYDATTYWTSTSSSPENHELYAFGWGTTLSQQTITVNL